MTETSVSPGNVRQFAKFVEELAEEWKSQKEAIKNSKTHGEATRSRDATFPEFGELDESSRAKSRYEDNVDKWTDTAETFLDVLNGLKDACNKIADEYESSEERANADVTRIQSLLGDEMPETDTNTQQPQV